MRILALFPFLPYPPGSGSRLRGAAILEILASRHEVTLVSLLARHESPSQLLEWPTYPKFSREPLTISRLIEVQLSPEGKNLRDRHPKSPLGMAAWMTYFDLPLMWNQLAELDLAKFDAVHVRYVSMAPYALALKRAAPHLRLVIDLDDIQSVIFSRKLMLPRRLAEVRIFLWEVKELLQMLAFECVLLRHFDSIWVCSECDLRKISRRAGAKRALIVTNAVDANKLAAIDRQHTQRALLFIGDFTYHPNSQGAEFFVTKVWPTVKARVPDAQLWLVGANHDATIATWNGRQDILVTGMVPSVSPYLERAMISIAPLLVGVGTRLKILEALGAGLSVVTTTIGAEGIAAQDGSHLLIADTAEDFAGSCIRLLEDATLRDRLGVAGKSLIREEYGLPVMAQSVIECYNRIEKTS